MITYLKDNDPELTSFDLKPGEDSKNHNELLKKSGKAKKA